MTGSAVLDVIIGLVFIYLLYSLLTSLIAEIIATNLGLRARNLYSALCRMLDNERVGALLKSKDLSGLVKKIYEHPEIKSLVPNRLFSKPSSISPETFAKALVDTLKKGKADEGFDNLTEGIKTYNLPKSVESYLLSIVDETKEDVDQVRARTAEWFDNTMESATEWYKRNMQILLFLLGFIIAWLFNINTIEVTKKLSVNKDSRDQLVQLAASYIENRASNQTPDTLSSDSSYTAKMDSLVNIKDDLMEEIGKSQSLIGGGTWLPDSIQVNQHGQWQPPKNIDASLLPKIKDKKSNSYYSFTSGQKIWYAILMLTNNLIGYFLTAIALSLGAPFWFDLLNKFMKLRGAISKTTEKSKK